MLLELPTFQDEKVPLQYFFNIYFFPQFLLSFILWAILFHGLLLAVFLLYYGLLLAFYFNRLFLFFYFMSLLFNLI